MDRLKLIAFDDQDLGIIAAHIQDAVLKVGDLHFDPKGKKFVIELNRFVWEKATRNSTDKTYERRKTILHFERVNKVQSQGLNQKQPEAVLSLLTVKYNNENSDETDPEGVIEVVFAGGATIHLYVECIEAQLTDMAASWETTSLPNHEDDNDTP